MASTWHFMAGEFACSMEVKIARMEISEHTKECVSEPLVYSEVTLKGGVALLGLLPGQR